MHPPHEQEFNQIQRQMRHVGNDDVATPDKQTAQYAARNRARQHDVPKTACPMKQPEKQARKQKRTRDTEALPQP